MKQRSGCSFIQILYILTIIFFDRMAESKILQRQPPSKPAYEYVSPNYDVRETGSCKDGTRVWIYEPSTTGTTTTTPDVVVYLHGYGLAAPEFYMEHIQHLVRSGKVVLFPQIQEGYCGILSYPKALFQKEQSSAIWAERTATVISEILLNEITTYNNVYLIGHSLGGAIAMAWGSLTSTPVAAAVLSSPQPAGYSAIPGYVTKLFGSIFGEELDVPAAAPSTTFPIAVLHASDDSIAPLSDVQESYDNLGSTEKAIYQAQTDRHNSIKPLKADHSLALTLPKHALENTLDWRYLWSALDQVMSGVAATNLEFDMGNWSDGVPVKEVLRIQ
jgi:pimeloyl-ACP methyl ester carboxylesterase